MLYILTLYWKPNFPREIQASKQDSASATQTAHGQFGLAVRPRGAQQFSLGQIALGTVLPLA